LTDKLAQYQVHNFIQFLADRSYCMRLLASYCCLSVCAAEHCG